jgi:hypothetical protein
VDHITENPRQSLHHWLKLLELHRINGNREGFEASARELHQHFNVEPVAWQSEVVPGSRDTIEAFPHLRSHVIKLWRQPDCVKFLQTLLLDNRDGTRIGFPLSVAEEILLLIAVLSSEPGVRSSSNSPCSLKVPRCPARAYWRPTCRRQAVSRPWCWPAVIRARNPAAPSRNWRQQPSPTSMRRWAGRRVCAGWWWTTGAAF